jgi:hypothetical protein
VKLAAGAAIFCCLAAYAQQPGARIALCLGTDEVLIVGLVGIWSDPQQASAGSYAPIRAIPFRPQSIRPHLDIAAADWAATRPLWRALRIRKMQT